MINTERGWRGGERMLQLLLEHLPPEVEAVTACHPEGALFDRLSAAGSAVAPLAARGSLDLGAVLRLRRIVRDTEADLIHAHTSRGHGYAWLARTGRPLLVTRHVEFPIGRLSRPKYLAPARIVAVSQRVRTALVAGGIPAPRIDVIHNGIDLPLPGVAAARGGMRAALGLAGGTVAALWAGRLSHEKNPGLLIEAWRRLAREHPEARLLIAGDGPLLAEVRRAAADLPGVTLLGQRQDLPVVMAAADVAVLSSDSEGLPLVAMEAMAAGLPVVSTAAGGIHEVVEEGREGFVVPTGDAPALADALARLVGDEPLRRRFGEAARRRAHASFGAAAMGAAYARLYATLLRGP